MNNFSQKIPITKQELIKNFIVQNFQVIIGPKQYAFWEIKNKDFCAVFYNSGKFVVQGKNIEPLLDALSLTFHEFREQETGNRKQNINTTPLTVHSSPFTYIGTDESGKGDFFGPLVIAGVLTDGKNRPVFEESGIKDSKMLKDEKILKLAKQIQKHSIYSVVLISNAKYNELYKEFKNLNKLLAWGHARVIENILEKAPCGYAISDKFGDESLIKNALMKKGKVIILEQKVRAESDIAVAAASILARAAFVEKMYGMEKFYKMKLPKGASEKVKDSAKEFIQKYGKERLNEVCKMHFKTYKEL